MMYASFLSRGTSTHRAFTLIELLVAVSIIGLLSSLVFASVNKARGDAKTKTALQFAAQNERIMGDEAVGMWNFEEGSGTTVRDASGWGNHGTISGATFTTDTYNAGVSKYALSFDGSGDYVDINPRLLDGVCSGTISLWIKRNSWTDSYTTLLTKSNAAGWTGNHIQIGRNGMTDNIIFVLADNSISTTTQVSTNIISENIWYHLLMTWGNSTLKGYVDGKETGKIQTFICPASNSTRFSIGRGAVGTTRYFNGLVDDVRVYARSLTAQEVREQYLAGVEKLYANGAISEEEYRARLVAVE